MSFCLPFRRLPALVLYFFSFFTAFSQTYSPVAALVHQACSEGIPPVGYAPFYPKTLDHPQIKAFAPTAQMMVLKEDELLRLYREQPPVLQLHLPYNGAIFTLELVEIDPLADDCVVRTSAGTDVSELKPGIHYRGILRGDCCGFAAVSIFENEISGLISDSRRSGNLVLGALEDGQYVLYADEQTTTGSPFNCRTEDRDFDLPNFEESEENSGKLVRMYWESNYLLFQDRGNLQQTYNYTTALFNQMAVLFANESIDMALAQLFIWATPDPYVIDNNNTAIKQFRQLRPQFEGDLAQLVAYTPKHWTGMADVDVLRAEKKGYAFSCCAPTFNSAPVNAWTVAMLAHQTGHNLGSNHTHWCGWPGGAIDNCRTDDSKCAPGPPAMDGGTVMSFCHQSASGIHLGHGFGPLPGKLIRSRVKRATWLRDVSVRPFSSNESTAPVKGGVSNGND